MNKRSQNREATHARLVEAALQLFAEEGFNKASMRQIAQQAGVSPGLSYHYYPSKEALLAAILEAGAADIFSTFQQTTQPLSLAQLLQNIASLVERKRRFWRLLHAIRLQDSLMHLLEQQVHELEKTVLHMLQQLPELQQGTSGASDARLLLAAIDGAVFHYLTRPAYPLGETFAHLHHLFTQTDTP